MLKSPLIGVTAIASLIIGCTSEPPLTSEQPTQPIVEKALPVPSPPPSDSCSNLNAAYAGLPIKPEVVIYTQNTLRSFPIEQIDDALKFYFSEKKPEQALLLYVHGRALGNTHRGDYDREPQESRTDVIPALSSKFKIDATIMLHWPHRKLDNTGFPESDAKSAGKGLGCIISRLNSSEFNKSQFPGFRFLETHSMGSLVLENAISEYNEDLHGFDAVVISAAASRADTANTWLPKIVSKHRYVLINTHDIVLKKVNERKHFTSLGKCDAGCFRENQPTSSIVYLDITDIAGTPFNLRHNYFVKGKVAENVISKILKDEEPPKGSQGAYDNVRIIKDRDLLTR